MEIAKKIASNTFAQVFARFFNAAISIVIVRIITGYLAAEGYGRYTVVYSFIAFFDIAADLGLFTIAVNEMSKAKERMERILGNILSLRLILVVVLALLAIISVRFFPNYSDELTIGIMIAAGGMALNHLGITLSSALQVHYKMPLNAIAIVVSKVVMVSLIYYVSVHDLGFTMLVLAGLINNALVLVITYAFARHYMRIRLFFDITEWKRLLSRTLVYGLSLICGAFFIFLGPLVLNSYGTEADVGIYGVANKIVQLLIIVPFAFMNSVLPSISRHIANKPRLQDIIQNSFDFLVTLGLGMVAGTLVLAGPIIGLISSGEVFSSSAYILQVLIFGVFFLFLHNLFSYILLATDKQKTLLKIYVVAAVVAIVANYVLIPRFGTTGAALASVIPQFIVLSASWFVVRRLGFTLKLTNSLKVLLAAGAMGGTLWLIDTQLLTSIHKLVRLAIEVPIGGLVFLAVLILTKGISPQVLDIVLRRTPPVASAARPRKIAIDVRGIAAEKTGKEWYTHNILEELGKIDHSNQYILYTKYQFDTSRLPKNFSVRCIRLPLVLWHPVTVIDMYMRGVDILLATTSYIGPSLCFLKKIKPVVVIHDTVAFLFPQRHQLKARIIEKYTVHRALKHARAVIAVSEHTKKDIVRMFSLKPEAVQVVGEAARSNFRVIDDTKVIAESRNKYLIPEKYILFVGTLEPRKNLGTLLQAFADVPERSTHKLVIIGKKGWYYSEIFRKVNELNLKHDVLFTGYVDDRDLPAILNGAALFVLPSLYEGFGLPLLEAFSCGTPVVTSDTSSLREIAANTCLMIDPLNVDELRAAMHSVLTNVALREKIVKAGFERTKEYSWESAARELLKIMNSV